MTFKPKLRPSRTACAISNVFTVILISDRDYPRFKQWKTLFEPFESEGQLKVCQWNRRGPEYQLAEVVPELSDAIYGKSEWRAVVVDTQVDAENDSEKTATNNPFDYCDNSTGRGGAGRIVEQLNLQPSPHPLIHLAHLLLGYSDITPKAFLADPSYWDSNLNRRVYESEKVNKSEEEQDSTFTAEQFRAGLGGKHDVQVHYREIPYTPDEIKLHQELINRYFLRHVRPMEVIFLSTQEPRGDSPIDEVRRAWSPMKNYRPSRFIERNDYPPSSRFLVHDLPKTNDSRLLVEKLRFWLALLCIAVNEIPGSTIQAERVYRIEIGLEKDEFAKLLNSQLTQLIAQRDFIDIRLKQPRGTTNNSVEEILRQQQQIRVTFDEIGGGELNISVDGYSWASDRPRHELIRWQESINDLRTAAETFSRRPRRALSRSVFQVRNDVRAFRNDEIVLDDIARDELEEELVKRSKSLAQSTSQDILNRVTLNNLIDRQDKEVRREIARRMEKRTILAASATVLLTWVIALGPYLGLAAWSTLAFIESLSVFLLIIGILGVLGAATLLVMKARFLKLIRVMNSDIRQYVSSVISGATDFTSYLTNLLTFMRGQLVLITTDKGSKKALRDNQRMVQNRSRLVEDIEIGKNLVRALGKELAIEKSASGLLLEDHEAQLQVTELFNWPKGRRELPLNGTGEKLKAPYDFIEHLSIINLNLLESKIEIRDTEQAELT